MYDNTKQYCQNCEFCITPDSVCEEARINFCSNEETKKNGLIIGFLNHSALACHFYQNKTENKASARSRYLPLAIMTSRNANSLTPLVS